jgi:hypothetical protein
MQAAQAAQQAAQISQQASQQAIDQMNQASQQANQQAMQNAQQAALNTPQCYRCVAAKPKFSVKPGARGHQAKDEGLDPRSRDLLHDRWLDADRSLNPIHRPDCD